MEDRIKKALEISDNNGTTDGGHHKMWVIDQMVRALMGCPVVNRQAIDCHGKEYSYEAQGESQEYLDFVATREQDGYDWDIGIAP